MSNLVEAAGYVLVVAFLYVCWAPLALLGAGVLLIAYANVRGVRKSKGRTAVAVVSATSAAVAAWKRARLVDVNRAA